MDQTFWAIAFHVLNLGQSPRYYSNILENVEELHTKYNKTAS